MKTVRIWDLPTRIFHWLLVLVMLGSFITVNLPGDWMEWHFRFGYAALTLLLFRLMWGFVGPRYARFSSFAPNPFTAWAYLRGQSAVHAGHNPLGAWSVYALLLLLSFQIGTGLFSNDAILWDGPLRSWVSGDTSDFLTRLHKLNRWLLIGWVVLHLAAISYYRFVKKQALVRAMLSGDALVEPLSAVPARDDALVRLAGLALLGISALAVWALVRFAN
jgi:cytochrome b